MAQLSARSCMYLVVCVHNIGAVVWLPVLYDLLVRLGGNELYYGIVLSVFYASWSLVSPLVGLISESRSIGLLISVCEVLTAAGMLVAGFGNHRYAVLIGMVLCGFGCGDAAVIRAYVYLAYKRNATELMANLEIAQSVGYIIGPLLPAVFDFLGPEGLLSRFSVPALATAVLSVGILPVVWTSLSRVTTGDRAKPLAAGRLPSVPQSIPKFPVMFLLFQAIPFSMIYCDGSAFLVSYAKQYLSWTETSQALILSCVGLLFLIGSLVPKRLAVAHWGDRWIILLGQAVNMAGLVVIWASDIHGIGKLGEIMCVTVGIILHSLGIMTCVTANLGLFAKMIGPRPQGFFFGLMTAAMAVGLALGPLWGGFIGRYDGDEDIFIYLAELSAGFLLLFGIFIKFMDPTRYHGEGIERIRSYRSTDDIDDFLLEPDEFGAIV